MQTFYLHRLEDETGVSGTGIVAQGVQFDSGKCVLAWVAQGQSVAVYESLADIERIHGHNGKTKIVWSEDSPYRIPTAEELGKSIRHYRTVNGLSQSAFAERAGLSRNCIALLEGGNERMNNLSVSTIHRILQAMHAPHPRAPRNALLHALFPEGEDDHTRAYRGALHAGRRVQIPVGLASVLRTSAEAQADGAGGQMG